LGASYIASDLLAERVHTALGVGGPGFLEPRRAYDIGAAKARLVWQGSNVGGGKAAQHLELS
jgi:hypothetical protein